VIELYTAILLAKQNMRSPSKNKKAMYGKYADLESVLDAVQRPLAEEGIIISQACIDADEKLYLRTSLIHAATGQTMSTDVPILMKNPNNPQELGGAMTYARRYGIVGILGIVADDDDDGNTAAGRQADGSPTPVKPHKAASQSPAPAPDPQDHEAAPAANLLTEKMVQALIIEFERAGYQGNDMIHAIQQVVNRKFGQLYNLTEAEGRAAVAWARKNKQA
jgi:hypothetical protein